MKRVTLFLVALMLCHMESAVANDSAPWKNRQITMIIGFAAGGGTDASGRLIAKFIGKHLPEQPTIVVRNQPGADGITALNYMIQQTKPDGLYVAMGSSSQVDPLNYRAAKAVYDPTKFSFIGGVARGRSMIMISKEAEARLYDKRATPAVMGSVGVPRSGMQAAAWGIEYLGWNAKWILGYRGTNDVLLALSRGEIDMTSAGLPAALTLLETGKFKVLTQTGDVEGGGSNIPPEIDKAPIMKQQMTGKIQDPIARQAFEYWLTLNLGADKWLALMPETSPTIVGLYRAAFDKAAADPEFIETGRNGAEDFATVGYQAIEATVKTLAATSPEAIEFGSSLLRKQGIDLAN